MPDPRLLAQMFPWADALPMGAMEDDEDAADGSPFGPAALSGLDMGSEPGGFDFGVPELSYEAPQLEQVPQASFLQSALMQVLGQMPNFAPQRNSRGAYPSGFERFAGVAGPMLARGVAGGIEGGIRSRQAEVNARNAAATNEAKFKNDAALRAISPAVSGAAGIKRERIAQTGAMARKLVPTAGKPEDWQRTPEQQAQILKWEKQLADIKAKGGAGLTFEQRLLLRRLTGENPKMNAHLKVIELQDKNKRAPLQRQLDNITQYGEPRGKEKAARAAELRATLAEMDVRLEADLNAALDKYAEAGGGAKKVEKVDIGPDGKLVRVK